MRFLAVSSEQKLAGDTTPTIMEQGYPITISNWRGIVAAPALDAATQQSIIDLLTRCRTARREATRWPEK